MSDTTSTPVTFTAEEQLKLRELEAQAQGFAEFRNAVARSMHSGQDAATITNLLQFLQNMAMQSAGQIEQVKKSATERSNSEASKSEDTEKKRAS